MINKREFPRYDMELNIEYYPNNNYTNHSHGKIYNISLGGIYMICDSVIEKNALLNIIFTLQKNHELIKLTREGYILRSGETTLDNENYHKYSLSNENYHYYAVVKFTEPIIELSFMLH